ncbi:hypothetical protein ASF04_07925 [Duganella sp. Leaf61]|uniref:hypothetical protein n=1 Tax=Duganella sp. Leaf61 TaxID=1736227 RepID=UPI0006F36B27|nr:hypothetical protein [Duganella sp. Leaf61]KQN73051.1 hypothetical protein ASF04_07925 [Duganella sp. Leaf61]
MNRPQMALDPNTGETLFDVFNENGFALLLGVSVADGSRIMAERLAVGDSQWEGEIRIVMARRGPDVLKVRISMEWVRGRLEVHCQVDRLLPSGLTVAELFAKVRPELVAAVEEAAARAPGQPAARQPVNVCVDVGEPDPSLLLVVRDAAACVADMDGHLNKLQRIVQGIIDGYKLGGKP